MRFLILAAVVVWAAGCLIPVDVTRGDGDFDGGTSGPCEVPTDLAPGTAGERVALPTTGCLSATVTTPDGGEVTLDVASGFVPRGPGEYVVTVQTPTGAQTRYLFVDGDLDVSAGVERRYVDRVDDCVVLVMTDEEKLVCEKNFYVSIYAADGGLVERFPGTSLGVLGNEIWSTVDGGTEHRTDTSSMVRFDGVFIDPLVGRPGDATGSVYEAGRSIRASSNGAVEVLWDGGTLAAGRRIEGLLNFSTRDEIDDDASAPFFEGATLWTDVGCTWAPGCSTMACTPIVRCDGVNEYVRTFQVISEERVVFAQTSPLPSKFVSVRRPLVLGAMPPEFERTVTRPGFAFAFSALTSGMRARVQSAGVPVASTPSVEPVITEHGMYLLYMDNVRTVQPSRTLVVVDPFTVRVVPR